MTAGNLTSIMLNGLNNPDCAFYTGAFVGSFLVLKWLLFLLIFAIIFKALDRLAFDPFLNWVKSKIYRRKEDSYDR